MATESSVLAVIRASRPTFRNPNDKVAFALHASFLAAGYSLIATGSRACSDNPPTGKFGFLILIWRKFYVLNRSIWLLAVVWHNIGEEF